jgi:pimeloyl-ACP methyl ester carboxylesterase
MSLSKLPPLRRVRCSQGELAWREAGTGPALVLLHGIGSGSGSWLGQFDGLADRYRILAWDAPGYGASAPLHEAQPLAQHYVQALDEWLRALDVQTPVLLGHSLGALVAAAWAAAQPERVAALVLASPARGYGQAEPALREAKYRERVELVERLGIEGLSATRAAGLCAPGADAQAIERVRQNMALATPGGYVQAAHLLAHDDLMTHLERAPVPRAVLCGEHDRVTPPDPCKAVARAVDCPFVLLPGVGHACYVEDARRFNDALDRCLQPTLQGASHG